MAEPGGSLQSDMITVSLELYNRLTPSYTFDYFGWASIQANIGILMLTPRVSFSTAMFDCAK